MSKRVTFPGLRLDRRSLLLLGAAALATRNARSAPELTPEMLARAQVSLGDPRRLLAVFEKAERGEDVVLAVLGGSISTGSLASRPENGYPSLVEGWWRARFPRARIRTVHAGVAGTGSLFGSLRVGQDVLAQKPDLVIVEFAVNDAWTDQEPYESILRRLLAASPDLAVLLLFMSYDNGHNEQTWQQKIGAHYDLPMISFRDALWPEIEAGRKRSADVLVDMVHPNDAGHRIAAQLVTETCGQILKNKAKAGAAPSTKLPAPLFGDRYQSASWQAAPELDIREKAGWHLASNDNLHPILLGHPVWRADGSRPLTVAWQGTGVVAMLMLANDDPGPVRLTVDGQSPLIVDAATQPRRLIVTVALGLTSGPHQVEIQRASNAVSPFGLFGLGVLP